MRRRRIDKPPYTVPSMAEVAAVPWNGLVVASLFAGAGGSSLGYRMAGYRVVYANEFVPAAQESYRANAAPWTHLDCRDVKIVKGSSLLKLAGLKLGELDVLDGSPPCQAFSMAGKREKGWGKDRIYEQGIAQKNEDLFSEYVRLRDETMPRAFVAENVAGLVRGTAKGFFLEILAALKRGYRVKAAVVDAQWCGVPQMRERVIFVGVREDLRLDPVMPIPLPYNYSIRDALPWLSGTGMPAGIDHPRVVHDTAGSFRQHGEVTDKPAPTIVSGRNSFDVIGPKAAPTINTSLGKGYYHGHEVVIVGNKNAPYDSKGAERSIDVPSRTLIARRSTVELAFRTTEDIGPSARHQAGIVTRKISPNETVEDNVAATLEGYAIGEEYDKLSPGQQSERFFSLVRPHPDSPSPTITAGAVGTDNAGSPGSTASVVHPTEKRKFTILEVKRLCSFPDDFNLAGTYGQQWERLGNSVPPLMMRAIASTLAETVLIPSQRGRRTAPSRSAQSKRG